MKKIQNILLLLLFTLNGYSFGQGKTGWEMEYLVGKVKTWEIIDYEFDVTDSINHDDFMNRFYQCGFDVDKMLSFADSINSKYNRGKHSNLYEFDSCGNFTNIGGDFFFLNEYDEFGRILRRIELEDNLPQDTVFFLYDETGRLIKRKYLKSMSEMKYDLEGNLSDTHTKILKMIRFLFLRNMNMIRMVRCGSLNVLEKENV